MLQRALPAGFIAPCLPTKTEKLPSGGQWLHEIKHDGFIARKDFDRVRLYSRPGNDMTCRFPLTAEVLTGLRSRSCIIDGEAVACDDNGLASFERIRYRQDDGDVFLYAFDLIELNGEDLRPHAFFANLHKIFWFQFEPVIVVSYFALSIQIGRRSSQYNS
jgi:bifunctional non-homologous end joining protein LigD